MATGMSLVTVPAQAAFELPDGEKITNVPAIPRAMPIKEAYELYDPKIGKNFDLKNFWLRADLRVRPEMRNNTCFGSTMNAATGNCNARNTTTTANGVKGQQNDQFTQQMTRLGIGYDVSPDVNFYMELINSSTWGTNSGAGGGTAAGANGGANDPALNHGTVGVRAAYMLVRNFAGVQGLSVKAGRQYIIFGNHSLFGHFDWANTGFSHDGIMLNYSTKSFDTYLGWFRTMEGDMNQGAATGSAQLGGLQSGVTGGGGRSNDADMLIFYNQIKSVPGFLIEPYYIGYFNNNNTMSGTAQLNAGQGIGTAKHSNQVRHTVGNRIEMRKGNFDATNELVYQFGSMGDQMSATANSVTDQARNLHINAWATRNWIGYTHYQSSWKPRFALNMDYASGDGRAQCGAGGQGTCKSANTFENLFPTNHIHMGYMDVQAWKNMMSPSVNFQARPTKDDHIEIWATSLNLANKEDNWYRGSQGAYVYSKVGNTKTHIGDELDIAYTHMFMDGKLAFQAAYGHLYAGGYIQENLGTSRGQDWAYAQLWLNF
ncbi:MAG: alginate export family protein [Nitrospira sp.]|nr:alginate export family protein [Nitrospira sp.]